MSRRRAHVAMIGIPAVSHVLPSLEIIRELVARGHRVSYANDPAVAGLIEATGAEFVPYGSVLPVADNNWPEDPIEVMGVFLDEGVQALPQLRAAYDHDPADLYLYDIGAYAARALGEAQGRPLMQLSPTYVGWEGYAEEVAAPMWQLPGADAYRARFARWLAGCGATTLEMDTFCGPPARSLALIPKAMQPNADRVDTDTVTFVGPCFGGRTDKETWTRPDGAGKVLLVSLGSAFTKQPEFYRRCLAAYGDLPGWHVVLQIGKYTDPAELGDIPANVEVHSWVPQLAILEQADAFVTHAGMGGSSEGLFTGVPMIAVPQAADQFSNADRLVELGVARRIDTEQATGEALRTALTELVADPEVARRSALLRAEVRAEGGTPRAAGLIEDMLG
ncbi:glycosyl transferase [Streptomyces sp. NBC_00053]|uniref:macrolide family glycosyltransferase n=1 Tax=unclassified Streptomyces TaxID=2593676 RepID=UPI000F5BA57F|nr:MULTISPECIES: macrolide family glycosyltransferase [unclassified Streptomyces]WSG51445.1 glycosyl transferase [Streptomyces sp. NBC_01732]WSX02102.1 glycosyl transferase [Streptomyces sp. NBC_00987]MCX4395994.1 glycosyl transferase [Streptomyces sp. NBC_01767]MCX5101374.1 glycosyl transferase [Streptomyces sp. NBC_00439]MCX5160896.1 glycosyl transferase [Streptomyces sp. NBC_00305]